MAGNALVTRRLVQRCVLVGVTARAVGSEMSSLPTPYRGHVFVPIVALQGMIARRVAIHAPGMSDHFADFAKDGARALGLVRNRGEFRRAFEGAIIRRLVSCRESRRQRQQNHSKRRTHAGSAPADMVVCSHAGCNRAECGKFLARYAAPAVTNFAKSRALANLLILVPFVDLKSLIDLPPVVQGLQIGDTSSRACTSLSCRACRTRAGRHSS